VYTCTHTMSVYNLTNKSKVPMSNSWTSKKTLNLFASDQYESFIEKLDDISSEHNYKLRFNPLNSFKTLRNNDSHTHYVYKRIYPFKKLLKDHSMEWLSQYEAMYLSLYPCISKLEKSKNSITSMRVFCVDETDAYVQIMQKFCNHVGVKCKTQHHTDTKFTTTAMSEYSKSIGDVDVIIFNNNSELYSVNEIMFTLMNLRAHGNALITLPLITHSKTICAIHLFTCCFKTVKLIHTHAGDTLYLFGKNFTAPELPYTEMYAYCATGSLSNILFTKKYIDSEEFKHTLGLIIKINDEIYNSRYIRSKKLAELISKLQKSASNIAFKEYAELMINKQYPDQTDIWIDTFDYKNIQT